MMRGRRRRSVTRCAMSSIANVASRSRAFFSSAMARIISAANRSTRRDVRVKNNNSASQRLRVIDSKIKVLYIERAPRWEFRYLFAVLLRDRRIEAKFVLTEGDPQLSHAPNSPYLEKFPATKDELFKYDLVV